MATEKKTASAEKTPSAQITQDPEQRPLTSDAYFPEGGLQAWLVVFGSFCGTQVYLYPEHLTFH